MRLSELGEFGLIHRLTADLATRQDVAVSVGDDAAVLTPAAGEDLVATIDAQVEGRHFLRSVASAEDIGHKALAVNLSDIAAMGAIPKWALVSLLVSPETPVSLLDGVYRGLRALAGRFEVAIVGGNVSATDGPLTIDVALLGQVSGGRALLRRGARPGDAILVTGSLGAAGAGALTVGGDSGAQEIDGSALAVARQAMTHPTPLVREGQALARTGYVTAMLDVSDGLAADLSHLCEASHVGAEVVAGAIPVHRAAQVVAAAYGRDPLDLALSGGEDYQLLFTAKPEHVSTLQKTMADLGGTAVVIGEVTDSVGSLALRSRDGELSPLSPRGWDHLRAPWA